MTAQDWIKLAEILAPTLVGITATVRYLLGAWLKLRLIAVEQEAALQKENIALRKEMTDKSFDQTKEAQQFIKVALVEVGKKLQETMNATVVFGNKIEKLEATTSIKIEEVTKKVEALEVKIKSVVEDIGEGYVRVKGGQKF